METVEIALPKAERERKKHGCQRVPTGPAPWGWNVPPWGWKCSAVLQVPQECWQQRSSTFLIGEFVAAGCSYWNAVINSFTSCGIVTVDGRYPSQIPDKIKDVLCYDAVHQMLSPGAKQQGTNRFGGDTRTSQYSIAYPAT